MRRSIKYIILGYLSGSVLFARICAKIFKRPEIILNSGDGNPGTANAFKYGGFICGVVTLFGDVAKGFVPVYRYDHSLAPDAVLPISASIVLAAPVIGHILPVFFSFHGGKGIAVTFGSALGLCPELRPLLIIAVLFILFSSIIKVTPHFSRTVLTFILIPVLTALFGCPKAVTVGFGIISAAVVLRLHMSGEKREKAKIQAIWMH